VITRGALCWSLTFASITCEVHRPVQGKHPRRGSPAERVQKRTISDFTHHLMPGGWRVSISHANLDPINSPTQFELRGDTPFKVCTRVLLHSVPLPLLPDPFIPTPQLVDGVV